ncbi:MAG: hypothetical protein Q9225_002816 [Loekoesia sp. 1 TL-2023]
MLSKKNAVTFLVALSSFFSHTTADLDEYKNSDGKTIWDEAPDFKNDPIQPYPDLKGPNGEDLTIENLRGVHLFGWKGCSGDEGKWIKEAYNDFYKLAQQPELYNNIDWNDQVIKDFFGPNSNNYKIPDDTRAEIQQIYAAAQQVYNYPWTWQPPWLGWRQLWIEVRCSGNDGSGDPDDKCGDRAHQPPQCPPRDPRSPDDDEDQRLEAFSEPNLRYSRITFCSKFFDLPTLTEAMDRFKAKPRPDQDNLENWNNRARCFFHEVTHLDYFMNADDSNDDSKSPEVFDAQFKYKTSGQTYEVEAYGPFYAKMMRNYIPKQKKYIGYYTQRNGELHSIYPPNPNPGRITPIGPPKKSPSGDPLFVSDIGTDEAGDTADEALVGGNENTDHVPGFHIPGCGDKYEGAGSTDQPPEPPPEEPPEPTPEEPGRTVGSKKAKRSSVKVKRIVVLPPTPTGPSADAELTTWIQDGANSKQFGPLKIDCKKPQDEWQNFDPKDTGLKYWLSIKSGHACTLNTDDWNLDLVGLRYANIGDMAVSSDDRCFGAEKQGASCVIKLDP